MAADARLTAALWELAACTERNPSAIDAGPFDGGARYRLCYVIAK